MKDTIRLQLTLDKDIYLQILRIAQQKGVKEQALIRHDLGNIYGQKTTKK